MNKLMVEFNGEAFYTGFKDTDGIKEMSYAELEQYDELEDFIQDIVAFAHCFNEETSDITITLTDAEDVFIWSIMVNVEDEFVNYSLIDWVSSGKKFKYEK